MNGAGTAVALDDLDARIVRAFGAGGALAASVPGFVPRASQAEMALAVHHAISAGDTLVAEAGTGTGKTFAYLVPALLEWRQAADLHRHKAAAGPALSQGPAAVRRALKRQRRDSRC